MRRINRRKFIYVTGLGAFLCGIGYIIMNSPIVKSMFSKSDDLPPGQYETDHILKWNIEHPGIIPENPKINLEDWKLTVEGKVENPTSFTWKDFLEIPAIDTVNDFHCVERWSVRNCKWYGVRFKTFVDIVKPTKEASYVIFYCSDGYTTSLNLDDLLKENVILAYKLDDEFLEESLGGPMRLIIPDKYGYKSAMWVERIKFTAIKEFGYWEKLGYNDSADVWKEERFAK